MMRRRRASLAAAALSLAALGACKDPTLPGPSAPAGASMASVTVTSKSFVTGAEIPIDYTCDGKDLSPQLTWSAPPEKTKGLVIIVDDPDAPSGTFTHWIAFNLPPDMLSIAEGVDAATVGGRVGANDFHNVRYNGPCPPKGEQHRYQFILYATDAPLPLNEGASRADVDAALAGHVLGSGALVALFSH
jgi:Raf kinase inhibitor-like YbhB/YbcL family protein